MQIVNCFYDLHGTGGEGQTPFFRLELPSGIAALGTDPFFSQSPDEKNGVCPCCPCFCPHFSLGSITITKSGNTRGFPMAQVTVKGQVTIPKRVRDHLGIKPGSGVEFEVGAKGEVLLRKAGRAAKRSRPRSRFEAVRGTATVKLRTEQILALTRGED